MESAVIPAVDVPSSFAALRSLRERGVHTIAVSERESPEVFRSRYAEETIRVPSPTESAVRYKDALLKLAGRNDVRTILPFREADAYVLSRYKDEFEGKIGTPFPDFETLRRVQDRKELFDIANEIGVQTPDTQLLTNWTDWERPSIVKGRYTILADAYRRPTATTGTQAVRADGDAATSGLREPPTTAYLPPGEKPDVEALCEAAGHVPLVQEYMPDTDEYSFCAMYDSGEPLATFQHRQIRGFNYSGGTSAFRKSVSEPDLEAAGLNLLDRLDWHGPADVEFKRDSDTGAFKLMEINPRFWSSVPSAIEAGADFPLYYWLVANGRSDRVEPGYEVGIGGHLLMGELSHLLSIAREQVSLVERPSMLGTLTSILVTCVRYPRFDYLDASDPYPAFRYACNELNGAVRRRIG